MWWLELVPRAQTVLRCRQAGSQYVAMYKLCSPTSTDHFRHAVSIGGAELNWDTCSSCWRHSICFDSGTGRDWTWPIPKMFELWVYDDVQHSKFSWLLLIRCIATYCYCVLRLHLYSYLQLQGRCLSVVELWERKTMKNRSTNRMKR